MKHAEFMEVLRKGSNLHNQIIQMEKEGYDIKKVTNMCQKVNKFNDLAREALTNLNGHNQFINLVGMMKLVNEPWEKIASEVDKGISDMKIAMGLSN